MALKSNRNLRRDNATKDSIPASGADKDAIATMLEEH